jgi:hypothetical protein
MRALPRHQPTVFAERLLELFPDPVWPVNRPTWKGIGTYEEKEIYHYFVGKRWTEVADRDAVNGAQDYLFFNREGLAYFLPAFLMSHMRGHTGIGEMEFESMLRVLSPLRETGFTRQQAQLLLDIWNWTTRDWGEEDDEFHTHNETRRMLAAELEQWPNECEP